MVRDENTHLKRYHLHQRSKGVCCGRTDVVIRITHPSEHWHNHEDDIGEGLDIKFLDNIWTEGPRISQILEGVRIRHLR